MHQRREVFTGTDTSDFVGLVRCTAEGVAQFTGMALELDAGNHIFTTLPVVKVNRGRAGEAALDFSHFANGASIVSEMVFMNLETQPSGPPPTPFHQAIPPIRPVLYFYDKEGNLIDPESMVDLTEDLEVTGDGALSIWTEMEPLGELTISTHGRGELVSGSVKVAANGPIGGVLRFDLPGIGVAGVGASQPVRDALFPARRQAGGISTAAAIHNIEEEAIVVSCRLMSGGVVLEEMEISLAAYGQEAQFIEEMFTTTDTSNFVGLVRCTGPGRFTGVAVELDAASRIFTTLPVVPVNLRGRGREAVLDFAHFANGEGITSDLVFVNVETQPSGPAPTPFHVAIPPTRPVLYFYDKLAPGYPFNRTHPGLQFSRGGSLEGDPGSAGARAPRAAWATPPGAAWWR